MPDPGDLVELAGPEGRVMYVWDGLVADKVDKLGYLFIDDYKAGDAEDKDPFWTDNKYVFKKWQLS